MTLAARLDELFSSAIARGDAPGVVAMAADRKGVVYQGAFGLRTVGQAEPMRQGDVFWLASMTKALVSTAAAMLVSRGELDLDAPGSAMLPELAEIGVLTGFDDQGRPKTRAPARAVTLRHLLTHTSGFGYDLFSPEVEKAIAGLGLPPPALGKRATLRTPLLFDPGDRWEYGIGIDWAGLMIEAATGASLGEVLREMLFAPLGMSSTTFALTPELAARRAGMHVRLPDGALAPIPFEAYGESDFEPGGGGLFGTAGDYLTFLRLILNDGTANGARLIDPEAMALLTSNQMGAARVGFMKANSPLALDGEFFPGIEKTWSLAFMINEALAPTGRAAGGLMWSGIANCYYWIDRKTGVCGVMLAQVLPFGDPRVAKLFWDFETAAIAAGR